MAVIFKIIPKVGPFKAIAFKMPNPDTETLYLNSVNKTVDHIAPICVICRPASCNLPIWILIPATVPSRANTG